MLVNTNMPLYEKQRRKLTLPLPSPPPLCVHTRACVQKHGAMCVLIEANPGLLFLRIPPIQVSKRRALIAMELAL